MPLTPDPHPDDPWALPPEQIAPSAAGPTPTALHVEIIENVAPLDSQIGVWPKKTVPDTLYETIFGQPEPTGPEIEAAGGDPDAVPPMQTYAILDAAKVAGLPELLENSGLEHRCLFKGDTYDELRDVAPWIVRLEEGNGFTRSLFTRSDAPWHLWDAEPGIFVRSRATLEDMWRHFRRFTRVRDETGKWYYLRFWDPSTLSHYMRDIALHGQVPIFRGQRSLTLISSASNLDNEIDIVVSSIPPSRSGGTEITGTDHPSFERSAWQRAQIGNHIRKEAAGLSGDPANFDRSTFCQRITQFFLNNGFRKRSSATLLTRLLWHHKLDTLEQYRMWRLPVSDALEEAILIKNLGKLEEPQHAR